MNLRHEDSAGGSGFADDEALPCILVVDDSRDCRELFISLVQKSGFRAIAAQDGHEAQLLLLTSHPVLVITDLSMPICDGWELLAFAHNRRPDVPVVLVSGLPLGRRPEIEFWAAGYIEKPIDSAALLAEIARLTSRAVLRPHQR